MAAIFASKKPEKECKNSDRFNCKTCPEDKVIHDPTNPHCNCVSCKKDNEVTHDTTRGCGSRHKDLLNHDISPHQ